MKRRRGIANDDDSSSDSFSAYAPPRIVNSTVNFALGPVNPHFTCRLCDGYFRDPITITECLHTFCKSCLYYAFSSGFSKCPTCDVELGPDPLKSTLHDRTKEELMDRVLFPDLKEIDKELERAFYAQKGIPMKAEYREEQEKKQKSRREPVVEAEAAGHGNVGSGVDGDGEEVELLLLPVDVHTPRIPYPALTTSGRMKVVQLKRFLLTQLKSDQDASTLEMIVNGSIVGNELSLTFIQRTMWLDHANAIEIKYRYSDEL